MSFRGWTLWAGTHKRKFYPRESNALVVERYIEDIRQDEKHVPDLLESIMRPPGLVKEELRPILFKIIKFGSKIQKIRVSFFLFPEFRSFRAAGQCQPSHQ